MKNYIFIFILCMLLFGCTNSKLSNNTDGVDNSVQLDKTNNTVDVDVQVLNVSEPNTSTETMDNELDNVNSVIDEENTDKTIVQIENISDLNELQETIITHMININNTGFVPNLLNIKKGEKVIFKNTREGTTNLDELIIGLRSCNDMKSGILKSGEEFSYIFTEKITCEYVAGIRVNQAGKIVVGE